MVQLINNKKRQNIKNKKRHFQVLKNKNHAATRLFMPGDNKVYRNLNKLAAKAYRFVLVSTTTGHETVKLGKEIE